MAYAHIPKNERQKVDTFLKWMSAIEKQMKSLSENDVWSLVELPKD